MTRKMNRFLALAASAGLLAGCAASPAHPDAKVPAGPSTAQSEPPVLAEDDVSARGRSALAASGIATDELRLVYREAVQFRDASLACGRPGSMAAQVLVDGYALRFSKAGQIYEVHVAANYAIFCGKVLASGLKVPTRPAVRARNLDSMINEARADLAKRLGVELSDVHSQNVSPAAWADHDLGCANPSTLEGGPVTGFRLSFLARGVVYVYHTDLARVMVCPPIEAQ